MNMEKFSVLMSVYKKEEPEFLDLSMESILINQSLLPDEFVLVCDGELTEDLERVIERYQKMFPLILKIYRKENGGLGKALNFGLPKCTYSLVARADSDDICSPDRFEKQVSYFMEHPEVGIISSHIDEFETNYLTPIHTKKLPLTHDDLYKMAKFRNPLNHMAVMMRKEDVLNVGSYRHIMYLEDYELWVRSMINGVRIANVDKVLVHARVGNGMIARRGSKKYIKSWHIMNKEMLKSGMIGYATYMRNMVSVSVFILMPAAVKEFLYRKVLREG